MSEKQSPIVQLREILDKRQRGYAELFTAVMSRLDACRAAWPVKTEKDHDTWCVHCRELVKLTRDEVVVRTYPFFAYTELTSSLRRLQQQLFDLHQYLMDYGVQEDKFFDTLQEARKEVRTLLQGT